MCTTLPAMKRAPKPDSNAIRPEDAEVGAKLAAAREAAGLTQFDVAVRAGWLKEDGETPNQQRVSHYEVGRRTISLHDFLAYAKAVGIDPFAILGLKKVIAKPRK